jgi:transcriptional regulator with XRE-family HTH domain
MVSMPQYITKRVNNLTPRDNSCCVKSTQMKTTGDRIRQARTAHKMTGEELAKKVGYKNQSAIANLENRATGTGGNKISAIADALGVSVEWLLRGPDDPNVPFLPGMNTGQGIEAYGPTEVQQKSNNSVHQLTTGSALDKGYDPWTREAIAIMTSLQEHEKRGAIANLRTYVHNLGPPMEQHSPANTEKTGTHT